MMNMTGWHITTEQATPPTWKSLTSGTRMMSWAMVTKMAIRKSRLRLVWDLGRRTSSCHVGAFDWDSKRNCIK